MFSAARTVLEVTVMGRKKSVTANSDHTHFLRRCHYSEKVQLGLEDAEKIKGRFEESQTRHSGGNSAA